MGNAKIGQPAPNFSLLSVRSDQAEPSRVSLRDYRGRWLALFFYPRDFSFVCPTELTTFSARWSDFRKRNCEMLGVSVDPIEMHREWMETPPQAGGLGPLQYPLASDPEGVAARAYGTWEAEKRVAIRGLFLIDPEGTLTYAVMHNLSVGRNAEEVLRVLDALQTGGLCPAGWTSADGTIDVERLLRPGSILGHYRIRRKIGSGSFGIVFAARDLRLERMVALKVLTRNASGAREAVFREARAAARLNHPHVCTIYAVDEEDGLPLIVMEYLEGQPLSKLMAQGLPHDQACTIAAQVSSAIATAHEYCLVHGDLKPANVLVTDSGAAKILDFGLARCQSAAPAEGAAEERPTDPSYGEAEGGISDVEATREYDPEATIAFGAAESTTGRSISGTLAYMSPEQAAGLPATLASDVFALGLTLFELLTGRQALADRTPAGALRLLRSGDLAERLAAQVPAPCQSLLAGMLDQDPAARPSARDVAEQLADAHGRR